MYCNLSKSLVLNQKALCKIKAKTSINAQYKVLEKSTEAKLLVTSSENAVKKPQPRPVASL